METPNSLTPAQHRGDERRTQPSRPHRKRAKTIICPAGYGFYEFLNDRERLIALKNKEDLPPWFSHLALDDGNDPDAQEAQVIAQIEAFKQTPEGRARTDATKRALATFGKPLVSSSIGAARPLHLKSRCPYRLPSQCPLMPVSASIQMIRPLSHGRRATMAAARIWSPGIVLRADVSWKPGHQLALR